MSEDAQLWIDRKYFRPIVIFSVLCRSFSAQLSLFVCYAEIFPPNSPISCIMQKTFCIITLYAE